MGFGMIIACYNIEALRGLAELGQAAGIFDSPGE